MTKLLDEFVAYLHEQVENHSIYVLGAQGQKSPAITEAWIKMREHNNAANYNRAIAFWKKQIAAGYGDKLAAFDCSGLGIFWLFNLKGLYRGDTTANGMYGKCKLKLTRTTCKRGDWVFIGTAAKKTHIGYIVDDEGTVIECRGRDYGVCKSKVTDARWKYFARPDVLKAEIEGGSACTPSALVLKVTKPYMRGDGVLHLQKSLNLMGYPCGDEDGIFGAKTQAALNAFVANHK